MKVFNLDTLDWDEHQDLAEPTPQTRIPTSRQRVEYLPQSGLIRVPKAPRTPREPWNGEWDHFNPRAIRTRSQFERLSIFRPAGYTESEIAGDFQDALESCLLHAFGEEAELKFERDASGKSVCRTIWDELKPGEVLEWPELSSFTSVARSWIDLEEVDPTDQSVLIGPGRWLTRGSGMMLIAPTGVGKSTWTATQCFAWALGRESLGLRPNGPLKSLVFQAEDDDGDLAAMARGIIWSLNPSDEERRLLGKNVLVFTEKTHIGDDLLQRIIRPQLETHRPDLLIINPLSTFAGCDLNKQEEIAKFLRVGLNAVLAEFGCAAIIVHHIPKPSKDRDAMLRAYSGAGSADLANWAREVVTLEPVGTTHGMFRMSASKRWRHLGWKDGDGNPTSSRLICHATDGQYWREPSGNDMQEAGATQYSAAALVGLVPDTGIDKSDLVGLVESTFAVSNRTARSYVKDLTRLKFHVIGGHRVRRALLVEAKRDRAEVYPGESGPKVVWVTHAEEQQGQSSPEGPSEPASLEIES